MPVLYYPFTVGLLPRTVTAANVCFASSAANIPRQVEVGSFASATGKLSCKVGTGLINDLNSQLLA